jgi:hypothetical protein
MADNAGDSVSALNAEISTEIAIDAELCSTALDAAMNPTGMNTDARMRRC